jgi:hypothetical protein
MTHTRGNRREGLIYIGSWEFRVAEALETIRLLWPALQSKVSESSKFLQKNKQRMRKVA